MKHSKDINKKNIFKIIGLIAFAIVSIFNVQLAFNNNVQSEAGLAVVEMQAFLTQDGEPTYDEACMASCYHPLVCNQPKLEDMIACDIEDQLNLDHCHINCGPPPEFEP